MKLGELLFEVIFKAESMKLKEFISAVGELNMKSLMSAGALKFWYEMGEKAVTIADEMALGLNKFSRETGMSTKELQQFTLAAEEMGMSPDTIESSVRRLQQSIFMLKKTGEGSNVWAMLGIDPTKAGSMFELLGQMREKFKGLSIEAQQWYANTLLGSTEMLNLFSLSDEEFKKIGSHMYLNSEQLKSMNEFHKASVALSHNLQLIWADMGVAIAPFLTQLSEIVGDIERASRESWVWKGTLDTISEILARIIDGWRQIFKWRDMVANDRDNSFWGMVRKLYTLGPIGTAVALSNQRNAGGVTQVVNAPIHVTTDNPDSFARFVQKRLGEMSRDIISTFKAPDQ